MKLTTVLCAGLGVLLSCSQVQAEEAKAELKQISNVRISMQRMLRSTEGRYFLDLYAGIWNPHAELYDFVEKKYIDFKGSQKGDQLDLKSVDDKGNADAFSLTGVLNANTGVFKSMLTKNSQGRSVHFEPAFKASDRPTFVMKFYGLEDSKQPYGKALKRVDMIDKNTGKVAQSLTGFTAYANSIGYLDVNFDGYFDVVLSDTSQGRKVEDKRFVYWMYNPKTKKFQRSAQLERIVGFPNLKGEKQQIDFADGQLFQVEKGLLRKAN